MTFLISGKRVSSRWGLATFFFGWALSTLALAQDRSPQAYRASSDATFAEPRDADAGDSDPGVLPSSGGAEVRYQPHDYPYDTDLSDYDTVYPGEGGLARYVADYRADGEYHQPVAIEMIDAQTALISTRLTGRIFSLQLSDWSVSSVVHESQSSWGELRKLDDNIVAVTEAQRHQVVILKRAESGWSVLARLDAPGFPNDLEWDSARSELIASGKWSQRLYRWKLAADSHFARWQAAEYVDLPMCGGQLQILPKHDAILVVDAFGRDYAVVNRQLFEVTHRGQLYGHNVTELAVSENEEYVYFPHQLLNEFARSSVTDITWGGLMSNNIRWLRTDRLLHQTGVEVFKKGRFYPLGTPGNGAGDPSSMAVSSAGQIAITLGGTNRVAIGLQDDYYFRQWEVGYHPVDCTFSTDGRLLLVVNQFSDSISVVDVPAEKVQHVSLGALRSPTLSEHGEQLFFSARLSHDGWMSCHSCHSEGHTNGQLNDNFTDQSFGTPKRILSLLGQAETMPYAWGGMVKSLEEQVGHSITSTMAADREPSESMIAALTAFVRSLPEPPSVQEARNGQPDSSLLALSDRGQVVFREQGCRDCHAGPRLTTPDTYDVGLYDEVDLKLFNPPSLVSLSQRQNSLLHDGRAKSIRDVFEKERHQLSEAVSPSDIEALIAYLQSL